MQGIADEELVERARGGDAAAFSELVHRHSGRVYGVAFHMLRHEQDAREVVQDTFLNAWRNLATYRGDAPFSAWIRRIASNSALMRLRSRRRKPEAPLELRAPAFEGGFHDREIVDWSPLADQLQADAELGARLRGAVDALPEKYRAVLVLADYEEQSMKEIAESLEISVPNVKTRLHRARLAVREALSEYLAGRM